MKCYSCDLETTTTESDCRAWAWGVCEIGNVENFIYGNDISDFFDFVERHSGKYYFHNLKFDGEFLINWLFSQGYDHVNRKELSTHTFTTLISDMGQFYSLQVCFGRKKDKLHTVTFYDSYKILPFKVKVIAKGFGLKLKKGEIDYNQPRPVGHVITDEELDYLRNDVQIVAEALKTIFDEGLCEMTQGSNALFDYKRVIGKKRFQKWFPTPDYDLDQEIRRGYKGGFTYCNPDFQGKELEEGIVLDDNSLYPYVMSAKPLPFGEPQKFTGRYEEDDLYPLYTQKIRCNFELKEGYLPTIQLKHNLGFCPTDYVTKCMDEEVVLTLSSVDLALFLDHYNIYNEEWLGGYKFMSSDVIFKDYIDKWYARKVEAKIKGNKAMYTLSKRMLNALYGKFGLNPNVRSKIPCYKEGEVVYELGEKEVRKGVYIPMAVFITAWGRNITIRSAQSNKDRFAYADTDSLHLIGKSLPRELNLSDTELGAWKIESYFEKAKFIRAKTYIEMERKQKKFTIKNIDSRVSQRREIRCLRYLWPHVTCAGMPESCYKNVSWSNFKPGTRYPGKLQQKRVKGGIILKEIDFSIKA